ncbi:hypothetical protein [Vibrio mediterranei]|uniref:hypothetical protein n=1 Tax=Vibrio mediterranei TaxID=689 RepID=UPI004067C5E7
MKKLFLISGVLVSFGVIAAVNDFDFDSFRQVVATNAPPRATLTIKDRYTESVQSTLTAGVNSDVEARIQAVADELRVEFEGLQKPSLTPGTWIQVFAGNSTAPTWVLPQEGPERIRVTSSLGVVDDRYGTSLRFQRSNSIYSYSGSWKANTSGSCQTSVTSETIGCSTTLSGSKLGGCGYSYTSTSQKITSYKSGGESYKKCSTVRSVESAALSFTKVEVMY